MGKPIRLDEGLAARSESLRVGARVAREVRDT